MPSKNLWSVSLEKAPDNQQERLEIANWIRGFVDGEGCFSVSFIRNSTTSSGWQIFPEFVVTQGVKSKHALEIIKEWFGCGAIYINNRYDNHTEPLARYCVRSKRDLKEKIIPFFQQNPLITSKQKDFDYFVKIMNLLNKEIYKMPAGLKKIAQYVQKMNRKVPSRFLESSETTRRTRK